MHSYFYILLSIRYMDLPDLDHFRMQSGDDLVSKSGPNRRRLPRHRKGEWFLKGPIPGLWLSAVAKLPGKALHVALAVWCESQIRKSTTVTLSHTVASRFGVGRNTAARALSALESAGLIIVDRQSGRCPRVTITAPARALAPVRNPAHAAYRSVTDLSPRAIRKPADFVSPKVS